MKITPDTNVLLRAVVQDDAKQAELAQAVLAKAELIALTLPALCELVWVLSRGYKANPKQIAEAIRSLMGDANVIANRSAIEAGLTILEDGGDFADAVIAYEGRWLGGDIFVTFDEHAAKLVAASGKRSYVPA